jgi:hypothetical protein
MVNQYTANEYSVDEMNEIVSLYEKGISYSEISIKLGRKKENIKDVLINSGVFVEGRDNRKKVFSDKEINEIIEMYHIKKLGLLKISELFNVSKTPIKRILSERNLLRKGVSNGKKINLSDKQKNQIRELYLVENKNCNEIGDVIGCSCGKIFNYLKTNQLSRNRSEGASIGLKKRIITPKMIENMRRGQRNLVLSGKRKQNGGVCKKYVVNGISCHGMTEKKYIENLINNNKNLPQNCSYINTPFGAYYPDFKFENKFIEVKSTYTYDILYGYKKSRWSKKYETMQLKKMKWVNENIMPVEIIIVDKNKIIEYKI